MLLVLVAGFGLTSCAKVDGTPVAASQPGSASSLPASTGPPGSSPAASATVDPVGDTANFFLPSRNIACYMAVSDASARCDIKAKEWSVPADPDCELDYGSAFGVTGDGEAFILCAGDTVFPADGPVLEYGHGLRAGDVVCVSSASGVRCESERTGHGFSLARAAYQLF